MSATALTPQHPRRNPKTQENSKEYICQHISPSPTEEKAQEDLMKNQGEIGDRD
jgi:hypothetical protein